MLFSEIDQQRLVPFCHNYIAPVLGLKSANQFVKAIEKPATWFADTIMRPRLFRPDFLGGVYYPVALNPFSLGRNHALAETIGTDLTPQTTYGGDPLTGVTFFANPLRMWVPITVGEDDAASLDEPDRPMDRVVLGDHQVFTFEFDVNDPEFLKLQLSWLRSSKGPLDCPMGDLYRECSGFADFAGLTVNYSGNKSLHIHVVFDTALAAARLGLGEISSADLRRGLVAHWDRLHDAVLLTLNVQGHRADRSLCYPESFRRIPNGSRVIESDGHLLGFPQGTIFPQVTLWEKARGRAAGDSLPLFFTPEAFRAEASIHKARRKATLSPRACRVSTAEEAYCEERLRAWYPEWPRFDHLDFEGGRYVAKFRNSEADATPSSIMREDYRTIHLVGRDTANLTPRALPYALGVMLAVWRSEFSARQQDGERLTLQEVLTETQNGTVSPIEERFRRQVVDASSARTEMEAVFRSAVAQHPLLLVVGPEGVGKTSVLMALHYEFTADLERQGESTMAMYAFADYEAARKKCYAFNAAQGDNSLFGVLLPSFSRAYEEECSRLGVSPISTEGAARHGFASRWAAIVKLQAPVIEAFRTRHARLWEEIGDRTPVFFTVHQVAHEWKRTGLTRLMWAPSFWDDDQGEKEKRNTLLRRETKLGLLVHDEVKADSLIEVQPDSVLWWVDALVNSDTKLWCAEQPSLPKLLASYDAYVGAYGFPLIDDREVKVRFEEVRRIAEYGVARWEHVVTVDSGEYGVRAIANDNAADEGESERKDIYGARHGRDWQVLPREWWHGAAERVVLLTTEAVPTAVARRADPSFTVYELETPLVSRDAVAVHPSRFVRGDNLATLCAEFRAKRSEDDYAIVSNKVAMLSDTMTHMAARGSNDLIGRNVVQTMTFMTPDEYERLQALNAWTGRSDLVSLRHIDEFNQTAGRNLGFRRRGEVRHDLLVNRRLLELLVTSGSGALGRARYEMQVTLDRHQRYDAKRAG
ncbi:hypothetical protein [Methylorubrum extorquens]